MNGTVVRDSEEAAVLLPRVDGYHKIRSWLALHILGIPTLSGVVVLPGDIAFENAVAAFAATVNAGALLVRTDRIKETGTYPRGGFLVSLSDLPHTVARFLELGRAVFLLEPRSPYSDLYSLAVNAWPRENFILELVGPGFDASDLKRGDMNPHERWMVDRSLRVVRRDIVSTAGYLESWHARIQKVGRTLMESPGEPTPSLSEIAVCNVLSAMGEPYLVDAREGYVPIPFDLAMDVVHRTARLGSELEVIGMNGEPFSLSMSFVAPDRAPIYWDIVWPTLKYEGLGKCRPSGE